MPFPFTCPHCHAKTLVEDRFAGQSGPCAQCGQLIRIPDRGNPSAATPLPSPDSRLQRSHLLKKILLAICGTLVIAGTLCILTLIALPAWRRGIAVRQRSLGLSNLRSIALALNAYEKKHGTYPPPFVSDASGKPLYSWRVLILPELGHQSLYDNFDKNESWDSPANMQLQFQMPSVYASPASPDALDLHQANYVLLTGNQTLFPGSGPFSAAQILDGPEQTILVTETANAGKTWTEPFDINVSSGARLGTVPYMEIGGNHVGEAIAVTVDGTPLVIPDNIPMSTLDALITPKGQERVDMNGLRQ